jgi:hypothetical protein
MRFYVGNDQNREQELEKYKEKLGIDELLVQDAMRKKISIDMVDVKSEYDRAMIEIATKIEARNLKVEP